MYARLGKEAQAGVEAWLREGERLRQEEGERIGGLDGDDGRGIEVERKPEWSNEPLLVGEGEASDSTRPRLSEEEPHPNQQPLPSQPQLYPQHPHHQHPHRQHHQRHRQEPYHRHDDTHQRQRQHHQHHHRQHQPHRHFEERDAPQIPHAPSAANDTLSPGRTVDRLVRKLSQQHLHRRRSSLAQQLAPPTQEPAELRRFRYWAEHEIHRQSHHHHPLLLPDPAEDAPEEGERAVPWLPMPTLEAGEPIEIDDEYGSAGAQQREEEEEALLRAALRRPRRQQSAMLRSTTSAPRLVVDRRMEDMIAAGEQCTVLPPRLSSPSVPPLPTSAPATASLPPHTPLSLPPSSQPPPSSSSSLPLIPQPAFIEADPTCALPDPTPSDAEDNNDDTTTTLRAASGPGGVRKYTVGGIALRYRLSADAALRCANVVRSRPRMRRRTKSRFGTGSTVGTGSVVSGMGSGVSSPVMSVAGSPGGLGVV